MSNRSRFARPTIATGKNALREISRDDLEQTSGGVIPAAVWLLAGAVFTGGTLGWASGAAKGKK